jgi:hypothetical protein
MVQLLGQRAHEEMKSDERSDTSEKANKWIWVIKNLVENESWFKFDQKQKKKSAKSGFTQEIKYHNIENSNKACPVNRQKTHYFKQVVWTFVRKIYTKKYSRQQVLDKFSEIGEVIECLMTE